MAKGRPKGQGKTGGRKAGTPNKTTMDIKARIDAEGFDMVKGAIELFGDESTRPDIKYKILALLFEYSAPKPKPTDAPPPPLREPPEGRLPDDLLLEAIDRDGEELQ